MKKIMIDMDDVITNGNMERMLEMFLGFKPDIDKYGGYRLQDILGDKKDDFFRWFRNINMYEDARLLPDCYDVLKRLNDYFELYIVTDYVWPEEIMIEYNGKFINDKYLFLIKELDFMKPNQFVFLSNKKLFNSDIKIDDRIDNLVGGEIKLLFTAYHNHNINNDILNKDNIIRVNNWKEIEEIVINNK